MRRPLLTIILISLLSFMAAHAYSEDAAIENVVITRDRDLLISFEVTNAFTSEVEEAIASGIPTSLAFTVELHRKRKLWFDRGVVKHHFRHTVKYDTLREEYSIVFEESGRESVVSKELSIAQNMMTTVKKLQLIPLGDLKSGERYRIALQAKRDAAHLPFPLNRLLFFISFGSFKTEMYVEEFVYE